MGKKFDRMIYVYEKDGKPKYATTALNTLRSELVEQGFKMPSLVTMKKHIKDKGCFESGSTKIYDLGLFKIAYDSYTFKNLKKI